MGFCKLKATASGLAFLLSATSVHAEIAKVDWASQTGGLDGVTVACANANKEKFAARICKEMMAQTREKFESAGIRVTVLGSYFVKEELRPSDPDGLGTPLAITTYIRASDSDGVHAINVRNQISVFYSAAVEAGVNENSRTGELVIWSGSTTGSGPRDPLRAAITGASFQKLEVQIDEIVKAWPK